MAIPNYQSLMLPLLKFSSDQKERSIREAIEQLSSWFKLSKEERKELLPSGQQYIFDNKVGWARTYLKKAGLLDSPKRGFLKITERGLDALKQNPKEINNNFLKKYPEFVEFQAIKRDFVTTENDIMIQQTPEESRVWLSKTKARFNARFVRSN